MLDVIGADHPVIQLDLLNQGASDHTPRPLTVAAYADQVQQIVNTCNPVNVTAVGISFGGVVLQHLMAQKAPWLKKAIIISGYARKSRRFTTLVENLKQTLRTAMEHPHLIDMFRNGTYNHSLAELFGSTFSEVQESDALLQQYIHGLMSMMESISGMEKDFRQAVLGCVLPTLIIQGERDTITPVGRGKEICDVLANGRLEVIRNGGHLLNESCPDEIAEHIATFVDN